MFAPPRSAAASYRSLDVETTVHSADPHRLVEMLYDGAITSVVCTNHKALIDAIGVYPKELHAGHLLAQTYRRVE